MLNEKFFFKKSIDIDLKVSILGAYEKKFLGTPLVSI